jgi:hypothetical protein
MTARKEMSAKDMNSLKVHRTAIFFDEVEAYVTVQKVI